MTALKQDRERTSGDHEKQGPHFREQPQDEGHFSETVGADLRSARSERKLGLDEVAEQLCIKLDLVRAIEESDFEALPGKTYAMGFVRAYAKLMGAAPGAEAEEYVRRFKAEMTDAEVLKGNSITRKDPRRRLPWGLIVTGAVTLVLAIAVWRIADKAAGSGDEVLQAFQPDLPETALVPSSISEESDAGTEVAGSHDETVDPATSGPNSEIPDGTFWGSENYDARLRVKAVKDVWLRIEVDGLVMFERVLNTGESYTPPRQGEIRILTRNAGDLELYVDGGYIRRLGKDGDALGARLDPDALLEGR